MWGAIIEGGLDLIGGQAADQKQSEAARWSAEQAQMQPYNVYGGGGAVQFDRPFAMGQQGASYNGGYPMMSNFGGQYNQGGMMSGYGQGGYEIDPRTGRPYGGYGGYNPNRQPSFQSQAPQMSQQQIMDYNNTNRQPGVPSSQTDYRGGQGQPQNSVFSGKGYYGQPAGQAPTPAQTGWGGRSQQSSYSQPSQAGGPQQSNMFQQKPTQTPPLQRGNWESTSAYNARVASQPQQGQTPQQYQDQRAAQHGYRGQQGPISDAQRQADTSNNRGDSAYGYTPPSASAGTNSANAVARALGYDSNIKYDDIVPDYFKPFETNQDTANPNRGRYGPGGETRYTNDGRAYINGRHPDDPYLNAPDASVYHSTDERDAAKRWINPETETQQQGQYGQDVVNYRDNPEQADEWDRFAYTKDRVADPSLDKILKLDPDEWSNSWEIFGGAPFDDRPLSGKDPRNIFTNLDPRLQGASNYLLGSGQDLLNAQIQGPRNVGGYSGYGTDQFNMAQASAQPLFSAANNQAQQNPGNQFFNQMQGGPQNVANSQYNMMEQMQQPGRQRDQRALEERLLSQGRLGSTGGALSEQAQQEAFGQNSLANMQAALGLGLQNEQQLFGFGTGMQNLNQQQAQLYNQLGQGQGGFFGQLGGQMTGFGGQMREQDIGMRSQDIARRAQDIGMSQQGLQRLLAGLQFEQSPLEIMRAASSMSGNASDPQGLANNFLAAQNSADTTAAAYGSIGEGIGSLFGGDE